LLEALEEVCLPLHENIFFLPADLETVGRQRAWLIFMNIVGSIVHHAKDLVGSASETYKAIRTTRTVSGKEYLLQVLFLDGV
jgi:hypothetical protein